MPCRSSQCSRNPRREADAGGRKSSPLGAVGELFSNPGFILMVLYFTLPAMAGWVIKDWGPDIYDKVHALTGNFRQAGCLVCADSVPHRGHRRRFPGRPTDAADNPRSHLHQCAGNDNVPSGASRNRSDAVAQLRARLPDSLRTRLGLLRLQQHAHPQPGREAQPPRHHLYCWQVLATSPSMKSPVRNSCD